MDLETLIESLESNSVVEQRTSLVLTDEDAARLALALRNNSSLVELDLTTNKLSPNGAGYISSAIRVNKSLAVLDLTYNRIGCVGAQYLSESLKENCTLVELGLISNEIKDIGAKYLSEAIKVNPHLTVLRLVSNGIGDAGAAYLAESLAQNNTLSELHLYFNKIQDVGVGYLADALKVNDTLTELDLSCNLFGEIGAEHIAEALKVNTGLEELHLSGNGISGVVGAKALASAISTNHSLAKLHLANSRIGDTGMEFLAKALFENNTLVELNLCSNKITVAGFTCLAAALRENNTIVEVPLYNNNIDYTANEDLINSIRVCLASNKSKKRNAFLNTLNGHQKSSWNRSRLMFVGNGGVGKTATVRSLLGLPFNNTWDSTVGAVLTESETSAMKSRWNRVNGWPGDYSSRFAARIMLQPGSSTYLHPVKDDTRIDNVETYDQREGNGIEYVYNDPRKEGRARSFTFRLTRRRKAAKLVNCHLQSEQAVRPSNVANQKQTMEKGDNASLSGSRKTIIIRDFGEELLFHAKREAGALNLSLWDFGGQDVFYSMHHIFLTNGGVYLVVFDMRGFIEREDSHNALCRLSFWLKSLNVHAPAAKILLVGTFMDDVQDKKTLGLINKSITTAIESLATRIVHNTNDKLPYFPIDNKSGNNVVELRYTLEHVIWTDEAAHEDVSMKWILLLDDILAKGNGKYVSLSEVKQMAFQLGILNNYELEQALSLFRARGLIIHLTVSDTLRNMIVTSPQWLIDSLTKVIRDVKLHQFDMDEFSHVGLKEDYERMLTHSIASRDILEYLWNNEHVDFFLDLMRHTMLLCEWVDEAEECYLIPSLLQAADDGRLTPFSSILTKTKEKEKKGCTCSCEFDFSNSFLPNGFFQSLLCLCIAHSSSHRNKLAGSRSQLQALGKTNKVSAATSTSFTSQYEPELSRHYGTIQLEPDLILHLQENRELLHISLLIENSEWASRSLDIIQSMLRKLNCEVMGEGLTWETYVEDLTTRRFVKYDHAKKVLLSPWFSSAGTKEVHSDMPTIEPDIKSNLDTFLHRI